MSDINKLVQDIVYGQEFNWIKVKAMDMRVGDNWSEMYQKLMAHHEDETIFLIDVCKQLAERIDDINSLRS